MLSHVQVSAKQLKVWAYYQSNIMRFLSVNECSLNLAVIDLTDHDKPQITSIVGQLISAALKRIVLQTNK